VIGGSKGALGKYDLDYWGASQKKAMQWLNTYAKPNATVSILMAQDVAAYYLRPDLKKLVNTVANYQKADYVVILNRQTFFYRSYYLFDYILLYEPVYTVENQGVPLVWVFDTTKPAIQKKPQWWMGSDPCGKSMNN